MLISKLMTLTGEEFAKSLAAFDATAVPDGDGVARSRGAVIRFEALPSRRLGGGLLSLPQARVTIDLAGVPEAERAAFQRAFDVAFQRGGG